MSSSPKHRPFRRLILWLAGVICTIAVLLLLSVVLTVLRIVSIYDSQPNYPQECALVFGAAVHRIDKPGPGLNRRMSTGIDLYQSGKVTRLIVSGGKGSDWQTSEADVMAQMAVDAGIPAAAVTVEPASASTWENLQLSKQYADTCDTLVAVSDRYHLYRIFLLSKLLKYSVPISLQPTYRQSTTPFELMSLAREVLGVHFYALVPQSLQHFYE